MFGKILVAVDVAEQDIAQPGLAAAVEMAKLSNGQVRLVHVRSPLPVTQMDFIPSEYYVEMEKQSADALAALAGKITDLKENVSVCSRFGAVYAQILQEAKDWGADMIIVSAHQPSMATYLLGSNAAKIVRHAECNVLVVRSNKKLSFFA